MARKRTLPEKRGVVCTRPCSHRKERQDRWGTVTCCSGRWRRDREKEEKFPILSTRTSFLQVSIPFLASWSFGAQVVGAKAKFRRPKPEEVREALEDVEWPEQPEYNRNDFARLDPTDDAVFYSEPKFVEHIDEQAQEALKKFYQSFFQEIREVRYGDGKRNIDILDLGSSWVSHFPENYGLKTSRVAGLGMNREELARNPQLTEYGVKDLNKDATLPYEDNSFDAVTCALTVDYLVQPLSVMKEVYRVLRRNGRVAIIFSNRLFITKAVGIWTGKVDEDRAYLAGSYIHYSGAPYKNLRSLDIHPTSRKDPLYAVIAEK